MITLGFLLVGISLGMSVTAILLGKFIKTGNPSTETPIVVRREAAIIVPRRLNEVC